MRIRRFVTWAGVTVTALTAVLSGAGPVAAGGPTSVMLVSPGSGRATALYATSPRYTELERALGNEAPRSAPPALAGEGGHQGREVTITWLAHDVWVWRVDSVYPDAAGGPWIHTRAAVETGLAEKGAWHKAARPKELGTLLERLGVMGPDRNVGMSAPDYPLGPAPSGEPAATARAATAGSDGGPADWWLSLPGLGAGLLIGSAGTLLVLRLISRRTPREPGPRQALVDA